MFYWIYCVSSKITLLFLSLTPVFLCFSSRWRRRWGRREIPRCRPPSALLIPIPLSRGPLPPPAPLPGTGHRHLPPEPPLEEDTIRPRHNFTCRCVWQLREALSLTVFLLCFVFLVFPGADPVTAQLKQQLNAEKRQKKGKGRHEMFSWTLSCCWCWKPWTFFENSKIFLLILLYWYLVTR